jgi:hypothetical protein
MLRKGLLLPGEDASSDDGDEEDDGIPLPDANVVLAGRKFDHLGRVYEVNAVGPTTVSAKVVWPGHLNERVDEFEFDDVLRWIRHGLAQDEE